MENASTPLAAPRGGVFWLTRDSWQGQLADEVDVWTVRPNRDAHGHSVTWMPPGALVDTQDTCLGELSLKQAAVEFGAAVPATNRECVRVARG